MLPLERLLDILDENKVKYPKKFKNIEINGYDSNRCERFADEIRESIERLLAKGINNGFDSNIKNAIYELADMAGDMSKYNIVLKLDDMQDKKTTNNQEVQIGQRRRQYGRYKGRNHCIYKQFHIRGEYVDCGRYIGL